MDHRRSGPSAEWPGPRRRGRAARSFAREGEPAPAPGGSATAILGRLTGLDPAGRPLVAFDENTRARPIAARALRRVTPADAGRTGVLQLEGGEPARPLLVGLLEEPTPAGAATPVEAVVDGERLRLRATKELVIECGQARITLTAAGKLLIEGAYVSSRSTGVNRLRGGTVEIN